MSKFKVGDKVKVLPRLERQRNQHPSYIDDMLVCAGKEFVVRGKSRSGDCVYLRNLGYTWHEDWLELVDKPFTQQDLEIGMLIELDGGIVCNVEAAYLDNSRKGEEVVAIYKPTETGFERIWTKPEPKLHTLELPNNTKNQRYYGVHTELADHYRFGKMVTNGTFKTQFTQEEIDNLPNQDLIKLLVKKEKQI